MKFFTHPDGIFEIRIPLDWHYKNDIVGYENKSPFSFELFQNTQGCFQISCFGSILFIMGKYKNIIFVYAKFSRNIFHSIRFSRALVC